MAAVSQQIIIQWSDRVNVKAKKVSGFQQVEVCTKTKQLTVVKSFHVDC